MRLPRHILIGDQQQPSSGSRTPCQAPVRPPLPSLHFCPSGGLGWGLPAVIGLLLGNPSRRVLALLGDGAVLYSVSG